MRVPLPLAMGEDSMGIERIRLKWGGAGVGPSEGGADAVPGEASGGATEARNWERNAPESAGVGSVVVEVAVGG